MPQLAWTVLTHNGKQYQLGLYHGDVSGHVVIHSEGKAIIADFSVLESRTYSFFLEDDLCEVRIEKGPGGFRYSCVINREADTPLNREIKKRDRRHWRQTLGWGGGSLLLIVIISILVTRWPSATRLQEEMLRLRYRDGWQTTTALRYDQEKEKWTIRYESYFRTHEATLDWPRDTNTPVGWPLKSGDIFFLYYSADFPELFFVDLAQPGEEQLKRYRSAAEARHYALHPELRLQEVKCEVLAVEQLKGPYGLWLLHEQGGRGGIGVYEEITLLKAFQDAVRDCVP